MKTLTMFGKKIFMLALFAGTMCQPILATSAAPQVNVTTQESTTAVQQQIEVEQLNVLPDAETKKRFACPVHLCDISYSQQRSLISHIIRQHCTRDKKTNDPTIKKRKRTEPYTCNYCKKTITFPTCFDHFATISNCPFLQKEWLEDEMLKVSAADNANAHASEYLTMEKRDEPAVMADVDKENDDNTGINLDDLIEKASQSGLPNNPPLKYEKIPQRMIAMDCDDEKETSSTPYYKPFTCPAAQCNMRGSSVNGLLYHILSIHCKNVDRNGGILDGSFTCNRCGANVNKSTCCTHLATKCPVPTTSKSMETSDE
jgi:hypothetical protein